MIYKIIEVMSNDLVLINSDKYGSQLWSKCRVRKNNTCVEVGAGIRVGDFAYRPSTNGYNRMERISIQGMESLKSLLK